MTYTRSEKGMDIIRQLERLLREMDTVEQYSVIVAVGELVEGLDKPMVDLDVFVKRVVDRINETAHAYHHLKGEPS